MIGWPRVGTMHVGMCLRCLGPLVQKAERYGCDVRNGGAVFRPDRHEYCIARSTANRDDMAVVEAEWRDMTPERKRQVIAEHERSTYGVGKYLNAIEQEAQRDVLAGLVDP